MSQKNALNKKKKNYPSKRHMNLYYKPDRTTVPATVALYVLFVLVVLLGLSKVLVYDLWVKVEEKQEEYELGLRRLEACMEELSDYDEVLMKYNLYSATDEEDALVDRMEILDMIDSALKNIGEVKSISVSDKQVLLQFSGVTLKQTAEVVKRLEAFPIVASTVVDTASTTEEGSDLVEARVLINLQKEEGKEE